jgi:hypothetical protein
VLSSSSLDKRLLPCGPGVHQHADGAAQGLKFFLLDKFNADGPIGCSVG